MGSWLGFYTSLFLIKKHEINSHLQVWCLSLAEFFKLVVASTKEQCSAKKLN
ncbi:hypothetical protein PNIG_a0558 [Pseudoalteromonas nigrifaciens]|uniref:Uncharacterized protein n=1 Tax=Pseudoalteromonas nigrifaciens TaxID=28109 RepID=A0AAC9XWA1_9GAMM|nr:hypothetical protein PNIG_a0558 [Pseudoalteromonas nigrifaciens]